MRYIKEEVIQKEDVIQKEGFSSHLEVIQKEEVI